MAQQFTQAQVLQHKLAAILKQTERQLEKTRIEQETRLANVERLDAERNRETAQARNSTIQCADGSWW